MSGIIPTTPAVVEQAAHNTHEESVIRLVAQQAVAIIIVSGVVLMTYMGKPVTPEIMTMAVAVVRFELGSKVAQ